MLRPVTLTPLPCTNPYCLPTPVQEYLLIIDVSVSSSNLLLELGWILVPELSSLSI